MRIDTSRASPHDSHTLHFSTMLNVPEAQISFSFFLAIYFSIFLSIYLSNYLPTVSGYPAGDDLVALVHVRYPWLLWCDRVLLALPAQRCPRQVRRAVHHTDAAGVVHRALTLTPHPNSNPNPNPNSHPMLQASYIVLATVAGGIFFQEFR